MPQDALGLDSQALLGKLYDLFQQVHGIHPAAPQQGSALPEFRTPKARSAAHPQHTYNASKGLALKQSKSPAPAPPQEHHHHSFLSGIVAEARKVSDPVTGLGNHFASDVRNAGMGFIPGVIRFAKETPQAVVHGWGAAGGGAIESAGHLLGNKGLEQAGHDILHSEANKAYKHAAPVREIGSQIGHDWKYPAKGFLELSSGQFGAAAHDYKKAAEIFYAHPLAPLLDIASVATLGGAGAAKLASIGTAAEYGRYAEAVAQGAAKEAAFSALSRRAQLGRPRDLMVKGAHPGEPDLPGRHLAGNPVTRFQQEAGHAIVKKLAEHGPDWYGIKKFTDEGAYARAADKLQNVHEAAHYGQLAKQMSVWNLLKAPKFIRENPREAAQLIHKNARPELENHSIPLPIEKALISSEHELGTNGFKHSVTGKFAAHGDVEIRAPEGWSYLKKDNVSFKDINSVDDIKAFFGGVTKDGKEEGRWAAQNVTSNPVKVSQLYRDTEGNFRLAPNNPVRAYGRVVNNEVHGLMKIYNAATSAWKWSVLGIAPRYFVNNLVGNSLMALMAGDAQTGRAFLDAIHDTHGPKAARTAVSELEQAVNKKLGSTSAIDKHLAGAYNQGLFKSIENQVKLEKFPPKVAKVIHATMTGTYGVTHKYAERNIRRMVAFNAARSAPEVKALMKNGHSFNSAVDSLMTKDHAFRHRIAEKVDDVSGQYNYYSPVERQIRQLVPFYGWNRHAVRFTKGMYLHHPARLAVSQQLGEQGVHQAEQYLGKHIPDFLKSYLPLAALGIHDNHKGRVGAINTAGLGPFATVGDTIGLLQAGTTGAPNNAESIGGVINPWLSAAMAAITGQKASGSLVKRVGGVPSTMISETAQSTPLGRVIADAIHTPTPKVQKNGTQKPFLFQKGVNYDLSSLAGAPVRQISRKAAVTAYNKEHHIKKGRKKKHYNPNRYDPNSYKPR